jgi:hypothetical protein
LFSFVHRLVHYQSPKYSFQVHSNQLSMHNYIVNTYQKGIWDKNNMINPLETIISVGQHMHHVFSSLVIPAMFPLSPKSIGGQCFLGWEKW